MCFPFSIYATCCSARNFTTATFSISKVVLDADEQNTYQTPWEHQQKYIEKKRVRRICICWCCLCKCFCKPMNNRLRRRVSSSIEKRAMCYKQLIEMTRPGLEQVKKWENNFDALIQDDTGKKLFSIFLQQEHSEENLTFWLEVNQLRSMENLNERKLKMKKIYLEYLKPMASNEINVAGTVRKKIEEELQHNPNEHVFDVAQNQVYLMMHRQSYPRFLSSDLYHAVVQGTYAYQKARDAS
ncbi:regulator of G-protein signaling 17-like isoform X2 [Hydractinia symbiolongicarpus]|nr:regulator of G-protein signaling 17-like isoform X2 [Hydractinia symbiolongicarpus]XP_057297739.1 regulator of G-protein signaling 17-like isoform X2 [Hydractinia symbiolongicarpus]